MRSIEKTLPVEHLNAVAMAEGNAKKPIYQMHKWWARRLGSVFRAIILGAFGVEKKPDEDIWRKFCAGANLGGPIVLDPFMGGGTTIAEALRLGCKAIGVDINPLAWFITKKEIEAVDLAALDDAFQSLEKSVGGFIRRYYRTKCPQGHEAEVMYFFWVKVATCSSCGCSVRLFPNYELSRRHDVNVVTCPQCLQVIETAGYEPQTQCPECKRVFDPRTGVSGRGVFRCQQCHQRHRILDAIRASGRPLDLELHALEGYCDTCGRFFKRVDSDDVSLWTQAKRAYHRCSSKLLTPDQRIPVEGRSDPRPVNHGYTRFRDMFNERQLLCLSRLLEEILKIGDVNIRELMLVAFSDCLDANNMFCKYEVQWHKISLFFGLHAYHPIERPAENNVWGTAYGRCTFVKCFRKVRRAKAYCRQPYERLPGRDHKRFSKRTGNERIEANIVASFEELSRADNAALLRCDTAERLAFLPDKSVHAVITDPPYFDNIQYSELADFFYVWLRLGLKELHPCFSPLLSSRANEIVQNENMGKTLEFFSESLTRVFTECRRVLKDDGLLVFTFHHNKLWAWESIAKVLLDSGFYISATPVVRSEGKSGFHSSKGNIRYDCVLVCRKGPGPPVDPRWPSLKELILKDAVAWARRTLSSGMLITQVDVFTIIMGKTIEYCTKAFPNIRRDQGPMALGEALSEMKDFASHVAETSRSVEAPRSKSYCGKAEQFTLLLTESMEKYGATRRTQKSLT